MEGKVRAGRGKGANQISRLSRALVDPTVPPCGGSRWRDRARRFLLRRAERKEKWGASWRGERKCARRARNVRGERYTDKVTEVVVTLMTIY